jgi:thioredoxin reductase (NADPH)
VEEAIVVGAGPCGLSAAIELKRIGLNPLLIEKRSLVYSIYMYPTYMTFFSTPELLEIGDVPFTTPNEKPTRLEALNYYRKVAEHHQLRIRTYETVTSIERRDDGTFRLTAEDRFGTPLQYEARYVVVATGYFDHPNLLGIPGEDLPHVSHYYREAHPYIGSKVVIIGGSNSAVDAALDLSRAGAEVTVVYRGAAVSPNIKPWVRPLFESAVQKGRIRLMLESHVVEIGKGTVLVRGPEQTVELENDFVLALTGFRPDRKLLASAGVRIKDEFYVPEFNPDTMETNVPGLYIAGVLASGSNANEVFIETGRLHGGMIARHIASQRG